MDAGNSHKEESVEFGGLTKWKREREIIHTTDAHGSQTRSCIRILWWAY